jgi:MSHA biogenesis protein MshJ
MQLNKLLETGLKWLNARNFRERILTLLIACAFTFLVWLVILANPLWNTQHQLAQSISATKAQITQLTNENNNILQIASQTPMAQMLAKQSGLHSQTENLSQRLSDMIPQLVPGDDFQKMVNAMLDSENNIELVNLKQLPTEEWTPAGLHDIPLPASKAKIYKHGVQIEFHASYFKTIAYLNRLESLPWRLYWNNLQYTVTNYPTADVVVTFYILSNQKS